MQPPLQQNTYDITYPEQYLEHFQHDQPPTDSFDKYFAPSVEPFQNIDLSELYNEVNLDSVFYPETEDPTFQYRNEHENSAIQIQEDFQQLKWNNSNSSQTSEEKRVGRPRIYNPEQKRERKLLSAKKSREKKKYETKQLFERVNEMKMMVEALKCTEYQFQDCFNDLLRYTSQYLYQK
uniref:BZIP domain-containing protein n=1 Tax=Panagrolaimus davidi TaxID=227884 RepID=A0A914PLZ6_9BILA